MSTPEKGVPGASAVEKTDADTALAGADALETSGQSKDGELATVDHGSLVDPRTDVHNDYADHVEPALRGRFSMEKQVVARVASEAAKEVSAAGGTSGGFLGLGAQRDFDARPDTRVTLTGGQAIIEISCGLPYPVPLRAATEEVRQHVIERVEHLTGVPVERVDIDIDWLSVGTSDVRRQLA